MVCDRLDNLGKYIPSEYREKIAAFVQKINKDMQEGFYEIEGDEIFARVMSYDGKERSECEIEAHDKYVDIQFTLCGIEGIDIFKREELKEKTEYNEQNDIVFFHDEFSGSDGTACGSETDTANPGSGYPYINISNLTGFFSMIFPDEAHRPQICVNEQNRHIKKGVIKIKEHCYE